jgi:diphosphomevalonate decarboxylase
MDLSPHGAGMSTARAIAHPNIALVKYWGKRDLALNLPAVPSLSLTLDGFDTRTEVVWGAGADSVILDGEPADPKAAAKVTRFLDLLDPKRPPCAVRSSSNFPAGAGLASSASAFAALAVAASAARGEPFDPVRLSVLARQGSGSACRSLWGGLVVWHAGTCPDGSDSHGTPLLPAEAWDLRMVVAIVSTARKAVGSTEGMERSRLTSPLYQTWVDQAAGDVAEGVEAVYARDLPRLGRVMEASTFKMHASMLTSDPPLLYWQPASIACLHAIWALRARGVGAWVTMDAGPQVKVLCAPADAPAVVEALLPLVDRVHTLRPGGPARLVDVA